MSTLTTGTGEEPDLSNLSLSRKEDFLLFAEMPPRVQLEQLTRSQIKALSGAARADRDRRLRVWHPISARSKRRNWPTCMRTCGTSSIPTRKTVTRSKARSLSMPSRA